MLDTSLNTIVQMVDNGLGATMLPEMAIRAGILDHTGISARPLDAENASRRIALIWRRASPREKDFRLLARSLAEAALTQRFSARTVYHGLGAFMRSAFPGLALLALAATAALGQVTGPAQPGPFATRTPAAPLPFVAPPAPIANNVAGYPAATASLSTLSAGLRATSLGATLSGAGPFTLFAPTDAAFARLAPGSVNTLLRPENKPSLAKLIGYHVVAGRITLADIKQAIASGGGFVRLTTIEGDPLTLSLINNALLITDVNGNKSYVEQPDVIKVNGVVHVVNGVLIPRLG